MKNRLIDALKCSTADYCEIRFETRDDTNIAYRGKEIDAVSTNRSQGGIVRACIKGGWGVSVFDSPEALGERVREACQDAALVGNETTCLAEVEPVHDVSIKCEMEKDFRGVSFDDKLATAGAYNDIILGTDPAIQSSNVIYAESMRNVCFASSRGAYYEEERPRVLLYLVAVGRDGSLVQRASESFSSATDYGVVLNREGVAREVAERAVQLLKAPQCPGGQKTVILSPDLTGVFAHEAFGHLSESDFLYENPQMKELMTLGRHMGVKELNIIDDGSMGTLIGTQRYDDEGTPTGRTVLISEGTLAGHLHSLETAAKMNEKPTGNARAIGSDAMPLVRMTNTYIAPGPLSRDELFSEVEDGIYACGMLGGQTMMEMFTFSAAYGFRIRNGKVCELLRDVVLTGNVFVTLDHIDGIADDFQIIEKGGGCGKGGQSPLPVTFGGPHVRIRDLVVGGR